MLWELRQKWIAVLGALIAFMLFCAVVVTSFGASDTAQGVPMLTIVFDGGDANAAAVMFGDAQRAALTAVGEQDGSVRISTPSGEETFDLAPRRGNGEIERSPDRREAAITDHIAALEAHLNDIDSGRRDVLGALHRASQATTGDVWLIASPLSLQAPADLRLVGLQGVEVPVLVEDIRVKGYLPDFKGGSVTFLALRPAGEQPALRPVDEVWLTDVWVALVAAGSGQASLDWLAAGLPVSDAPSGVVPVPVVDTTTGGCVIDAGVLFQPNSADFLEGEEKVREALAPCVRSLSPRGAITVVGHVAYVPDGSDEEALDLSRRRAQSVADVLIALNVDAGRLQVAGVGDDQPIPGIDPGDPRQRRVEVTQES